MENLYNYNFEQSILGSMILKSELIDDAKKALSGESFYSAAHRVMFNAMVAMRDAGEPIDMITLEGFIKRQGNLDIIGGLAYIAEVQKNTPSTSNFMAYVNGVSELAVNRNSHHAAMELVSALRNGDAEGAFAARSSLDGAKFTKRKKPLFDFHDALSNTMNMLCEVPPPVEGVFLEAMPLGEPAIATGTGGVGKTWLTLQIAFSVASGRPVFNGEYPFLTPSKIGKVLVLGGEDSQHQYWNRMYLMMKDLHMTETQMNSVMSNMIVKSMVGEDLRIVGEEKGSAYVTDFGDRLVESVKPFGDDLRLIIIDPMARFYGANENDNHKATMFVNAVNKICQETGAAVLLMHHSAKAAMGGSRGASAFVDGCRTQFSMMTMAHRKENVKGAVIAPEDKDTVIINMTKSNHFRYWDRELIIARQKENHSGIMNTIKVTQEQEQQLDMDAHRENMRSVLNFVKANGTVGKTELEKNYKNINWKHKAPSRDKFRELLTDMITDERLVKTPMGLAHPNNVPSDSNDDDCF